MPDVCVVIPSFNYSRFLSDAVESVWRQTTPATEILISDDGSRDDSVKVANALAARSPIPIKVIATDHVGLHESLNRSLRATECKFVAFLAADDRWTSSFLFRQLAHFDDPNVVMAHCGYSSIDAEGRPLGDVPLGGSPAVGNCLVDLLRGQCTVRTGTTVRRDVALSFGAFDASYPQEDWSFYLRCAARGAFGYSDAPLVERRIHGTNSSVRFATQQSYTMAYNAAAVPLLIELAPDERVLADALAFHLGVPLRMSLFHAQFKAAASVLGGAIWHHPRISPRLLRTTARGLASLAWDRTGRRILPARQLKTAERMLRRLIGV